MDPQKELDQINSELDRLLYHGTNDENLVTRKRELEALIRLKSKNQKNEKNINN